jgi:hypothetical protein
MVEISSVVAETPRRRFRSTKSLVGATKQKKRLEYDSMTCSATKRTIDR